MKALMIFKMVTLGFAGIYLLARTLKCFLNTDGRIKDVKLIKAYKRLSKRDVISKDEFEKIKKRILEKY